jgi:hypothetical protein
MLLQIDPHHVGSSRSSLRYALAFSWLSLVSNYTNWAGDLKAETDGSSDDIIRRGWIAPSMNGKVSAWRRR